MVYIMEPKVAKRECPKGVTIGIVPVHPTVLEKGANFGLATSIHEGAPQCEYGIYNVIALGWMFALLV